MQPDGLGTQRMGRKTRMVFLTIRRALMGKDAYLIRRMSYWGSSSVEGPRQRRKATNAEIVPPLS